jgi:hypothetical protein
VAINDKVDDLLAGILKQIRIFIDAQQKKFDNDEAANKNLKRNNSDAFINELIKKTSSGGVHNTISFKANTLTRRLFKSGPKNKDPHTLSQATIAATSTKKPIITTNTVASSSSSSSSSSSFSFVKFFNTLFKKKSNQSHIQSVENLFTPPVSQAKYKKLEK